MKRVNRQWQRSRQALAVWRAGALPGLTVMGLVVVLRLVGLLQPLEWWALDLLLRLRPSEPTDEHILIVGINEADIQAARTYPIPDAQLAALIAQLQTDQPRAIGLDIIRDIPVEPGHSRLAQTFQTYDNIIGIEKALPAADGETVKPPPALPPAQVGFADLIVDRDGASRRALVGTSTETGYAFSLPLLLAERYLVSAGFGMENGIRDPQAMRFGTTEFDRFHANSGGYINADARGNQFLINYRSGKTPFHIVSMADVMQGRVPPGLIRDRLVLIGMMATSVGDLQQTNAAGNQTSGSVYGVEIHAHITSQMISAVLQNRPWLNVWTDNWEYVWILGWGSLSIALARFLVSPFKLVLGIGAISLILVGASYGALLVGWWLTLIPTLLALGSGLPASLAYRHEQELQTRLRDRQLVIEQIYTAIHNNPVQTLKRILSNVRQSDMAQPQLYLDLERLEEELRAIEESARQETLTQSEQLYLCGGTRLDLQHPIHQLLHGVYRATLTRTRDFPSFKTVIKIVSFEQIESHPLTLQQKRGLCRFLEEALCNAGKYAEGMTRLDISCKLQNGWTIIRVADDGKGLKVNAPQPGYGSRQAASLARQLGGTFRRTANFPRGTICELAYPMVQPRFWTLFTTRIKSMLSFRKL